MCLQPSVTVLLIAENQSRPRGGVAISVETAAGVEKLFHLEQNWLEAYGWQMIWQTADTVEAVTEVEISA